MITPKVEVPTLQLEKLRWWSVSEVSELVKGRYVPFLSEILLNDVCVMLTDSAEVEEFVK